MLVPFAGFLVPEVAPDSKLNTQSNRFRFRKRATDAKAAKVVKFPRSMASKEAGWSLVQFSRPMATKAIPFQFKAATEAVITKFLTVSK
jgi:hypothetical protein